VARRTQCSAERRAAATSPPRGGIVVWLLFWILFVVFLFVVPLGYGWGYRGWGPPYPSYYQRRRRAAARDALADADAERQQWGVVADLLWVVVLVAIVWLLIALAW
jgi:hypothetical protein